MGKVINDFEINDIIIMLDGRTGVIIDRYKDNNRYYQIETHDDTGVLTYFKVYCADMRHQAL